MRCAPLSPSPRWLVCFLLLLTAAELPPGPAQAQTVTEVYCADFNFSPQGWTALDVDATRRPTEIFWHLDGGDWFLATTDPCFVDPGPGYGNSWAQLLEKTYTLPSAPVSLDLYHQYNAEPGFDFCYVEVLPQGASDFVVLQSFGGVSPGVVNSVVDLSAYAGTSVTIRFRFTSDNAYSDEDGLYPTNGAWRIDRLTVSGHAEEDFGTDQGWVPSSAPLSPTLATLRRAQAPCDVPQYLVDRGITSLNCEHPSPCGSQPRGTAWVAFDPATQALPEVPEDYDRRFIPGIESPLIPIPPPVGTPEYRLEVDVFGDQTFNDTRVIWQHNLAFPSVADPCPPSWSRENSWNSLMAVGWYRFERIFLPPPGATDMKIRLNIGDWDNLTGTGPGTERGKGPFFDNVRIIHVTAPPGPPILECASDVALGGEPGCTFPAPQITLPGIAIRRVLDDTTPQHQLVVHQTPAAGTPMSSGESITVSITDQDGLESESCEVRYWNGVPSVASIEQVTPTEIWPANHALVPVSITFRVQHECPSEPVDAVRVLVSSSEPDDGPMDGNTQGDVHGEDGFTGPVEIPAEDIHQNPDGSFTATFDLRAERSTSGEGRVYTISVQGADPGATNAVAMIEVPLQPQPGGNIMLADLGNAARPSVGEDGSTPGNEALVHAVGVTGPSATVTEGKMILEFTVEAGRIPQTPVPDGPRLTEPAAAVSGHMLESIYPNPTGPSATLRFTLAGADDVAIMVVDVRGRLVRHLAQGRLSAGSHQVVWDGFDDQGAPAAPGAYFIKLRTSRAEESRKLILVR